MNAEEMYQAWKRRGQDHAVPDSFADSVMQQVNVCQPVRRLDPAPIPLWRWGWAAAVVLAASAALHILWLLVMTLALPEKGY